MASSAIQKMEWRKMTQDGKEELGSFIRLIQPKRGRHNSSFHSPVSSSSASACCSQILPLQVMHAAREPLRPLPFPSQPMEFVSASGELMSSFCLSRWTAVDPVVCATSLQEANRMGVSMPSRGLAIIEKKMDGLESLLHLIWLHGPKAVETGCAKGGRRSIPPSASSSLAPTAYDHIWPNCLSAMQLGQMWSKPVGDEAAGKFASHKPRKEVGLRTPCTPNKASTTSRNPFH